MRKITYTILFLFTAFLCQAQSVKFGVKGGLNYSDPSIVNTKANAKIGYHVGGLSEIKFSKFAIQPELMYSVLGAEFNGNVIKSDASVGYLTLPVFVKVYVLKKISIEAGPQISYAISKDTKTTFSGNNLGEILQVNDFDYGVSAGATVNLTDHYFVQLRGVYGFNEITKTTGVPQIDSFVVKNRALQLSFGYMF
ncbi:MAG: PorT family protein [Flavobacterium sp.]|nr:PorT family protein [Flavobacterium sp.]